MTRAVLSCALAISALAAVGAGPKFHALAIGAYPPGSRVAITTGELDAYLRAEVPALIGPGVRNPRLETDNGNIARGYLDIDFLKVKQARGEKPNWLLSQLLSGERPVVITVRVTSGNAQVRVDVIKVSISGVVAEGRTLDFLIRNFLLPNFPAAKIGQNFALDYNIDRLEIRPGVVTIVLKTRSRR